MLKSVSSITNALGALNYKGTWNASTNSPALASGVGTKGDYYVVSVAGSTNLDGTTLWGVGDWAVFNGTIWQKVDGGDTGNFTTLNVTNTANIGPSTAGVQVSGTTVAVVGSDSNIDLNLNPKGTGTIKSNGPTEIVSGPFSLTGNISAPAWTTNGIRYKNVPVTLTDTSSSGTVAAAYTNVFGGNTIAASNVTTFTEYFSTWISNPNAGSNVTITTSWSLGTQGGIKAGGNINAPGYQMASSGVITESGTSRTLSATDNGKVIYCTSGSAVTITCAAGLGAGFSCTIVQGGAGKVTVAAGGQTLVSYSGLYSTMGQYAVISAICPVANTFLLAGNLGV